VFPPDTPVAMAVSAPPPADYGIATVAVVEVDGERVVYLGKGDHLGDLPAEVGRALGWL
jgi:hypothetical protein